MTITLFVAIIFGLAGFLILWFSTGKAQLVGVAILAGSIAVFLQFLAAVTR